MGFNYGISLSGLNAGQLGLKVAQQNIANINTEGYARQRLELRQNPSMQGAGTEKSIGTGVIADSVKRVVDEVLQSSYNTQNSTANYFQELESILYQLETVTGEFTEGSLSNMMGGFFNAWEEMAKFPEEESYRFSLLGETEKLTNKINDLGQQIASVETSVKETTRINVAEVNILTKQIAEINERISDAGQNPPNGLLNERDIKITELSKYLKVESSYENTNPNIVTVRAEGTMLVDKGNSYDIRLLEEANGQYRLAKGSNFIELSSGSIKAGVDAVNKYIGEYRSKLEELTTNLIDNVNGIHRNGFSMNGDTGFDFFVGDNSKNIKVNSALVDDPLKIATTSDANAEGRVDVARQIAKVIEQPVFAGLDFRDFTNNLTMGMSQDVNTVQKQAQIQDELLKGIDEQKQRLQGVNLEEEMTNLMMFQKYFTANSKAIKMLDDMLGSVLQMI